MNDILMDKDAIAVVGMSCRFPESASLDEYWSALCAGKVCVSFLTGKDLEKAGVSRELRQDPSYVPAAYRLKDIDKFDAAFFGYAGSEAEKIDPQQRFFLECSWAALEDAGYSPLPGDGLEGRNVAVFGGARISSYLSLVYRGLKPGGTADAFQCLVGNDKDYLCSRVSYKLNLNGPSLGVQSACSSSLAAVHTACETLRSGACDMALAGGAAIDVHQGTGYLHQDGMIFSPDGYCRPFDKDAGGTVFSGGCGVVVLKRLEDAMKDGDDIYAVILSSVINNDGARRVGYTAPGEFGQTSVLGEAIELSGLSARDLGYVETHGTGTAIGDPIEFTALAKVFGHFTSDRNFCALGAVKANIGHADAAAGIASFIKAVMAVRTGLLPPHPLFHTASDAVNLAASPFYINTELVPWKETGRPRTAGVSSFGIGGSNAHVIISQAPGRKEAARPAASVMDLFTLSSRTEDMVRKFAGRMAEAIEKDTSLLLSDICFTVRARCSSDQHRLAVLAGSKTELAAVLKQYAAGGSPAGALTAHVPAGSGTKGQTGSAYAARACEDWLAGAAGALDALQQTARKAGAKRVHLPSTPFRPDRCWPAEEAGCDNCRRALSHPVWKSRFTAGGSPVYEGVLAGAHLQRLLDHRIQGRSIAPASLYLELMHAAGVLEYGEAREVHDMEVAAPLSIDAGTPVFLQLVLDQSGTGDRQAMDFYVSTDPLTAASWRRVARAALGPAGAPAADPGDLEDLGEERDSAYHYRRMLALGVEYGPEFQLVRSVRGGDGQALLSVAGAAAGWNWDPALLDACLQGVIDSIPADAAGAGRLFVPAGVEKMILSESAPQMLSVHLALNLDDLAEGASEFRGAATMYDALGSCVGRLDGLRLHEITLAEEDPVSSCYEVNWLPAGSSIPAGRLSGRWLVLCDKGSFRDGLAARLKEDGCQASFLAFSERAGLAGELDRAAAAGGCLHVVHAWSLGQKQDSFEDVCARGVLALLDIVQKTKGADLVLLTSGCFGPGSGAGALPGQSLLWGFASVLRQERPELGLRVLDLEDARADGLFLRVLAHPGREVFLALRSGQIFRGRLCPMNLKAAAPSPKRLTMDGRGLDGLALTEFERRAPAEGEIEVALAASSLNFRDVMMAMGIYPGTATAIGSDGAGVVTRVGEGADGFAPGDRVAVTSYGCLSSHITVPAAMAGHVPSHITLEQAAGVPVAFITAAFGLENLAGIKAGQTVLVHAASGGVGLAALQICRLAGARVIGTAGSGEKRALALAHGAEICLDSRSASFASGVLKATDGRGVDCVLNSLTGELQELSLSLVADGGAFVELGKSNVRPEGLMQTARGSVRYFPVDLYEVSQKNPEAIASVFARVMQGLDDGSLSPLPVTVFASEDYGQAFQLMTAARHKGKIVLAWAGQNDPAPAAASGTELITGGLGGLGLRLAQSRAEAGCPAILLAARRAPTEEENNVIEQISARGCEVRCLLADAADYEALRQAVLEAFGGLPPLTGLYHLAGVLEDAPLAQQTEEKFRRVLTPKVQGAWNLHRLSLEPFARVSRFVLFSSTAYALGAITQAGYAAANAYLAELARWRRRQGLPGLTVGWGAFSEAGMAHKAGNAKFLEHIGIAFITPEQGFARQEQLLKKGAVSALACSIDWNSYKNVYQKELVPPLLDVLIESGLKTQPSAAGGKAKPAAGSKDGHGPAVNVEAAIEAAVRGRVASLLRTSAADLDADANLIELGVDSLLALNLFQFVEKEFHIRVDRSLLFEQPTISGLCASLAGLIRAENDDSAREFPAIVPSQAERFEPFPLMDMQSSYWVGRTGALVLGNVSCHVYLETEMGNLDVPRWEEAWNKVILRHDMLRSVILENGSQRILDVTPRFRVPASDQTALDEEAAETAIGKIRGRMSSEVLPATEWPLFRAEVTKLSGGRNRLHISLDLLVADLHSMNLIMRDLERCYLHPEEKLEPLELSFRDYVLAQNQVKETPRWQQDRDYWLSRVQNLAPGPDLPLAVSPAQLEKPSFTRHAARLDRDTWAELRRRAAAHELTVSGLLLACYAEVLARWSSRDDFTIDVTLFNRLPLHKEVTEIVGDFTSVSLLGCHFCDELSFLGRAQALQKQLWSDMDHSLYSGVDAIREWSRLSGQPSSDIIPIVFTSTIGFGDEHGTHPSLRTFGKIVYNITQTPQVWIDHQVREVDDCLDFNWDAVDELFPAGLVNDMFEAYCRLLEMLARDERVWHKNSLPLLPQAQLERRARVNATAEKYTGTGRGTLDDLFVRQLVRTPEALAVAAIDRKYTYRELGSLAEGYARMLQQQGVKRGDIIPVVSDGGVEETASALAVTSLGAVYMPVDAAVPAVRLHHLIGHARARVVLTQTRHRGLDWPSGVTVLEMKDRPDPALEFDVTRAVSQPDDLAYIIHTSGSTGAPKGVMIRHGRALNTILAVNEMLKLRSSDRVLALSRFTFDLSVWDIFGLLGAGGALVLLDPARRLDAGHWLERGLAERVTIWNTVPPLMQIFAGRLEHVTGPLPPLRAALLSGDWIPLALPKQVHDLWPELSLYSLGGATEASIWSNFFPVGDVPASWKSIPYGVPLPNQRFHVLNRHGADCPDNVPGELHIAGDGLADGYLHDPTRTMERFVRHPLTGEALYATGDMGRYLSDGNIEFLGRQDNLVKINGYRVELGEIENTLLEHPQVGQAVALAMRGRRQGQLLAVFASPSHGAAAPAPEELRSWLADRLPAFLVPGLVLVREHLPLTSSGKVDRKQLAVDPDSLESNVPAAAKPGTETERLMADVMSQVLNGQSVDIDSRFFEMGLSSLDLITVQNLLQEKLQMEILLMVLLEHTTIRRLAAWVDERKRAVQVSSGGEEKSGEGQAAYSRGMERAERRMRSRRRK